jgi:hypothetical protein
MMTLQRLLFMPARQVGCLAATVLGLSTAAQAQTRILFVGNSFVHGKFAPVIKYNLANVTDENAGLPSTDPRYESVEPGPWGGIPGIFKKMTDQAGLNYEVHLEAISGNSLKDHNTKALSVIAQSKWNKVVLQEYSTTPLPTNRSGNRTEFYTYSTRLEQAVHAANPAAQLYLYETWARADKTYPAGSLYAGLPIDSMTLDLHRGYYQAFASNGHFAAVAPAGDAWLTAITSGLAMRNPYAPEAGKLNLWGTDNYHPSKWGSYLNACVLFGQITGLDPRTLGASEQAASELGIESATAVALQQIAYQQLKVGTVPTPTPTQALTSLTLINADTDQPIPGYTALPANATLNLAALPTRHLNIQANTAPTVVGSVRFGYDTNANYRVETQAPYALASDTNGDYNAWTPTVGKHTLTATPFTKGSAGGEAGTPLTITLTVIDESSSVPLRNPDSVPSPIAGLGYAYYQGSWSAVPAFATLSPVASGSVATFSLTPRLRDDAFAFRYTGYVSVPTDGVYTFYTSSDDGSQLFIGSTLVVDNDGLHGTQEHSGQIGLKAGLHAISVGYFDRDGSQVLQVNYAGPGLTKALIPASALFQAAPTTARTAASTDTAAALTLYPNPAHTIATLTGAVPGSTVYVFDAFGRPVVQTTANAAGTATLTLPEGLPTGTYIVRTGSQALNIQVH